MLAKLAIHMSAMLAFLSAEAVIVALLRMIRGPNGEVAAPGPSGPLRIWVLIAFILYLGGAVIRESVVLTAGVTGAWGPDALMVSALSRAFQLSGAAVFIGAVTHRQCGHWIWAFALSSALIFAVVVT